MTSRHDTNWNEFPVFRLLSIPISPRHLFLFIWNKNFNIKTLKIIPTIFWPEEVCRVIKQKKIPAFTPTRLLGSVVRPLSRGLRGRPKKNPAKNQTCLTRLRPPHPQWSQTHFLKIFLLHFLTLQLLFAILFFFHPKIRRKTLRA